MGGGNRSLTGTTLQPKLKLLLIFTKLHILQTTAHNTKFSMQFNDTNGGNNGVIKNLHMLFKTCWTKAFMTAYSTVFTILIRFASTQIYTCNKSVSRTMTKDKPQKINSTKLVYFKLHPLTLLFVVGYICRKDHMQRKVAEREDRLSTDLHHLPSGYSQRGCE